VLPQTLSKYWVPDLAARLEKEPKKWKGLAQSIVFRVQTDDERALATLRSLATSSDAELRRMAISAIIYSHQALSGDAQLDDTTRKLIEDALQSKDPATVRSTLQLLTYVSPASGGYGTGGMGGGRGYGGGKSPPPPTPQLRYRSAMFPLLLFHADESVRREARSILRYLDDKDAPQVVEQLVAVLKDRSRSKDPIAAMRAVAAMGVKGKHVMPELIDILMTSNDLPVRDAAMVALVRCSGKHVVPEGNSNSIFDAVEQVLGEQATEEQLKIIMNEFNAPRDELGSGEQRIQRLTDENNAILPPENQNLGGGGFF
jgi:HEAT repeat protein